LGSIVHNLDRAGRGASLAVLGIRTAINASMEMLIAKYGKSQYAEQAIKIARPPAGLELRTEVDENGAYLVATFIEGSPSHEAWLVLFAEHRRTAKYSAAKRAKIRATIG